MCGEGPGATDPRDRPNTMVVLMVLAQPVSERPCPGKPLDTPPYPSPCQRQLTKSGRELFYKAWLSSLMAQGPGEARHYIAAAPGPPNRFRLLPLQASRHVPVHRGGPPKPRNCVSTRVSFEFRAFPGPLKTQGPKGVQSRMFLCGFLGVWV